MRNYFRLAVAVAGLGVLIATPWLAMRSTGWLWLCLPLLAAWIVVLTIEYFVWARSSIRNKTLFAPDKPPSSPPG